MAIQDEIDRWLQEFLRVQAAAEIKTAHAAAPLRK